MRAFRPGDLVTSIAVVGQDQGIVYDTHWDGAEVIWSNGRRSTERYQDLIYNGTEGNWKNRANSWVDKQVFEATVTRPAEIRFDNQPRAKLWGNTDLPLAIVDLQVDLPVSNFTKIEAARASAREQFIARRGLI
jgi:hypothetical protein